MTEASTGLGKALARAGSKVLAIGEMSATDILASMSDEQKAELFAAARAAHPEPDSTEPDGDKDDANCSKCKEPMKDGKCSKCSANAEANAADPALTARAEERARFTAVMSSEHYKGRESLAATLLASDKLSADEIIAALAASGTAGSNASDDAARAEMRAAISASTNSNVDANGPGQSSASANHRDGWGKATAAVNKRYGLG